jgi:hypothetical protein
MLRFQILLVSLCMVVLVGYSLCLPVIFATPEPDPVEVCAACLPPDVTLDTCFRRNGSDDPQTLTVRDRLRALGAYRRAHVGFEAIYGEDGLPIQFYVPSRLSRSWLSPRSYVPIVSLKAAKQEAVRAGTPVQDFGAGDREREDKRVFANPVSSPEIRLVLGV